MTIISSKFQNNDHVMYAGSEWVVDSKVYCSDLNEWKYYLQSHGVTLSDPISEEKINEIK